MLPEAGSQTLNTGGGDGGSGQQSQSQAAVSSTAEFDLSSGGQMPTMPEDIAVMPSAETLNTDGGDGTTGAAGGKVEGGEGDKGGAKAAGEADPAGTGAEPFHKHPRFQELIGKNRTLEQQIKTMAQQLEALSSGGKGGEKKGQTAGGSDPVSEAQRQRAAIQEDMDEGKISFAEGTARLQEVSDRLNDYKVQAALQAQAREVEASKIQENFLKENSDFIELRDSGKLQEIMDSNPLHDVFSAYFAHKAQQVGLEVQSAVDKAVKETEDRLRKEFQSKRNAASLGAGAAHVANTTNVNPALSDTKKFGGKTTVLAEMLKNMRAGQK